MREIDGCYGEGGGQLLRTAVALAAITGETIRLHNIRAKRSKPGMAAQHVAAVKAVAALCGAEVEGLQVKSTQLLFRPGLLRGGQFHIPVGTAGSIPLVLQAALPVAIASGAATAMHISGGTDVRAAPPLDYLRYVLLPLLGKMGLKARVDVLRRGYYPRGGGEILVAIEPAPPLRPLLLDSPGALKQIHGYAHIANLPEHIVQRMAAAATAELTKFPAPTIEEAVLGRAEAIGAGGAIVLAATTEQTILGASATAERGVPAEQLGLDAGQSLHEEISTGATLDFHATDQILIYLALAGGASRFLTRAVTSHAATTMWLLEQFLPVSFSVTQKGLLSGIEIKHTSTA